MYTYFVTYSMEDNVKKIILLLTLCLTITFLVGCSCEKKETNGGNDLMPVKDLYTSDSKLVYDNAGIFKLVFEFKNDEVTSCEHYYEYESEEDAKPLVGLITLGVLGGGGYWGYKKYHNKS